MEPDKIESVKYLPNRAMKRRALFHKPTKYTNVKFDENNNLIMYLHPTKGFKGNKKAIREFKNKGK